VRALGGGLDWFRILRKLPTYRLEPLPRYYSNWRERKLVVNATTGEVVALVSDKYLLVQPRKVFATVLRRVWAHGVRKVRIYWNNSTQFMEVVFVKTIEGPDSAYRWGIRAVNNVAGRRCLAVHLMLWREVCCNDLFLMFGGAMIHVVYNARKLRSLTEMRLPRLTKGYLEKLIALNSEVVLSREEALKELGKFPKYVAYRARRLVEVKGGASRWELANELSHMATRISKPLRRAQLLEKISKMLIYPEGRGR